jgi:hypothetical protein
MAVNLVSPGVKTREVDLTIGAVTAANDQVGAFVGPFQKGPVDYPILIETEQDLLNYFGKPISTDSQSEYWLSASAYLSYGGILRVVRTDSSTSGALNNANSNSTGGNASLKIKSYEDYVNSHTTDTTWTFAAKNPGSWANSLKVCVIDAAADQILSGISTSSVLVGYAITVGINTSLAGVGTVTTENGYIKGIITGVGNSAITVKIVNRYRNSTADFVDATYAANTINSISSGNVVIFNTSGVGIATTSSYTASDWYNQQTLGLTNSTVYWSSIAPKPGTSLYTSQRNGKNDEIHVIVVDDIGTVTGTAGNVVEKFVGLSKATDAKATPSQPIYFDDFIALNSNYIFAGLPENGNSTGFTASNGFTGTTGNPNTNAQGTVFSGLGAKTYTLAGGTDYTNGTGSYAAPLANIISSYNLFASQVEYPINFLINGPSGGSTIYESQSKANALISIAENRKDCVAVISPHKADVVNVTNSDTQTSNIIKFFSPLTSSSYTVFDSGYKYTYDRFNNQFVYLACNADIAGLMARTSINQYPWFSPAGAARGAINNAVKLAYNPSQSQRDLLYTNRVNPIIASPGQGIILFGDKTAQGYQSAFDRINVRRLFLTLESTIERAARAQLFEFNDAITRSNFVNLVEPYLRDVKAKRGITEFLLVCDESNNTPDVIDANRFRADIYVKPARSINFIGLTFVATRTGISFSEVVGSV